MLRVSSLLLSVLFAMQVSPTPAQHTYSVLVMDKMGAAISEARITVHRDSQLFNSLGPFEQILSTSRNGEAKIDLQDAFYDVCVMSDAFAPQCRKIRVAGKDIHQEFRLEDSREVTKEIADPVY